MKNAFKLIFAGLFLLSIVGFFLLKDEPTAASGPSEVEAVVIAQAKVKERLKSPTTANFPNFDYKVADQGNGRYIVRGYVDAANDFNATKRINYILTMQHEQGDWADAKNWKVEDLVMQ